MRITLFRQFDRYLMLRNKRFRALSLLTTLGMSLASFNTFADTDIFTALDDPSTAKKSFDGDAQASYCSGTLILAT